MVVLCVSFTATATTAIYTLSLHDALPIFGVMPLARRQRAGVGRSVVGGLLGHRGIWLPARQVDRVGGADDRARGHRDRKSTRLNSSHVRTSYAVFCLKKKHRNGPRGRTTS